MISNDASNMVMPVSPMGANAYGNDGFGGANGGWWWFLILFFLIGGNGNWGWGGNRTVASETQSEVQRGFDQASVMNGVNGIASSVCEGFAGVQNLLCNGFAGVNATVNNGFANLEANANARQIANMQQAFAAQTAVTANMNNIASALQNCCCENRANVADLKYTVATENCADRAALSDGLRDMTTNNTANTNLLLTTINAGFQGIKDELCADRIAAKDAQIATLERQLTMANLAASQNEQTAAIQAGQRALANEVEQYVLPTPRPAYVVANPNCCNQNTGCGCGSF